VLQVARRLPAAARLATERRTPPLRPGRLVARHRLAGTLIPQPGVLVEGRRCRLDDVLDEVDGGGPVELRALGGGRFAVRALDSGRSAEAEERTGALAGWLRSARAEAVVVRPDRIVRSAR
jgi:3-(3-hydroxy-phenyl)propionate hydroxylase